MKKAMCFWMVAAMGFAAGAATQQAQLERREAIQLVNAGFENGKADGWHFHSNMSIDDQVAHSGRKSAKVVYGPNGGGHVYLTREIPVQGGARYDALVWMKTENVTEAETKPPCCGAGIIVEWLDKKGRWLTSGQYDCNVFGTANWQLKRCVNLVAPEDAGFAEIYLTLRAHGTVWFDDLSFNRVYMTTDKIAPARGATLADNTPFFTWRHGRCIRRYLLELSRDSGFPANATRVFKVGGLSEYQLTQPLEPGQWFWRVSGPGMEDAGPWSFTQTAPKERDCVPPRIRARGARVTSATDEFRLAVEEEASGADPVVTFRGDAFAVTAAKVRDLGKGVREYAFRAPADGWPKGVVEGTIAAVDAAGNRLERTFWLCNAPRPANRTSVRKDGYWECGGRRFTPLGIYEVTKKDMREVRAAGFDVVHTYRWESDQNDAACREYLDDCWAADGLRAFIGFDRRSIVKGEYGHVARRVARLADHPGLFCWYLFDEPEIANQFVSPDQLTAYADLIRELDPYHTVVMTTWNKSMCEYRRTWDTHWSQAYGNPAEVVQLVEMQRRDIATYSPITLLFNCNDGKQGNARRRGVEPDPAKFARDYDHLRACAFLALPLECNGVFWWWFARDDKSFYSASQVPKAWADLTRVAKELAALRPVVDAEGPCTVGEAKDGKKRILWWSKTVDGRTTLVAVNTASEPAQATIGARAFSFRRYEVKVLQQKAFQVEREIAYSTASPRCVLDVRSPADASNCAVVVNFHGGGLTGGDKCFAPWPAEGLDADAVVQVGVRYRLMKTGSDEVKPQDCIADAAAATAWTIRNIARYGGDPKKVFLTGVSAGGYLTAMVGLDAKWLAPHGLRPADLAGIVPLTGQMTKHFNVRKIGFRDEDPQFLPKIDEWAPLFYAGRPGLPPACFCTGGRDVEWKCRVEENELLAHALRDCGHRAVEFHETEGDHGGGVQESAYCLRDFVMSRAEADGVARFADGERVVFFGDSITHGGRYVFYLQLFQNLRRPGAGTRILNGGISGDTAFGGVERWRHDILPMKPSRVFVMFGMNDVGRGNYASETPTEAQAKDRADALRRYEESQRRLARLFDADGVKAVFMTPSPYDQYSKMPGTENLVACNEPGLAACARIVRTLAAERHAGLVDLHAPLTDLFKGNPDHPFCGDRVHPGADGHLIMAAHILESMRYSPVVARAVVDAAQGRAEKIGRGRARNCVVTDVTCAPGRVAFTYAPKALPFPKLPEYVAVDGVFHPLTERLNQELLVVKGLAAGRHALKFDGRVVGSFDAAEFARGVNVSLLETPNQARACAAAKVMAELQGREVTLRQHALVCGMIRRAGIDPADQAAANRHLDAWLAREAKSRYIGAFRTWVESYRKVAPVKAVLDAEAEDLYERMAAVRPAVSRVSVEAEAK